MNLENKFKKHIEKLQNNHFTIAIPELIHDFAEIANREFTDDYKLQQKAINTLNDSGLKLMEENAELKCTIVGLEKLLSNAVNIKYLDRQKVEKIIDNCYYHLLYKEQEVNSSQQEKDFYITAICNLALVDRKAIKGSLVKLLNLNTEIESGICDSITGRPIIDFYNAKDNAVDLITDEIISAIGGK